MSNCNCHCHVEDDEVDERQEAINDYLMAEFLLQRFADDFAPHLPHIWTYGDGEGGNILIMLADAAEKQGFPVHRYKTDMRPMPIKKPVPKKLRRAVFERDDFRCQAPGCGDRYDITVDHIHPESKGGETSMENLQTLCRSCNSKKGAKVPPRPGAQ